MNNGFNENRFQTESKITQWGEISVFGKEILKTAKGFIRNWCIGSKEHVCIASEVIVKTKMQTSEKFRMPMELEPTHVCDASICIACAISAELAGQTRMFTDISIRTNNYPPQ